MFQTTNQIYLCVCAQFTYFWRNHPNRVILENHSFPIVFPQIPMVLAPVTIQFEISHVPKLKSPWNSWKSMEITRFPMVFLWFSFPRSHGTSPPGPPGPPHSAVQRPAPQPWLEPPARPRSCRGAWPATRKPWVFSHQIWGVFRKTMVFHGFPTKSGFFFPQFSNHRFSRPTDQLQCFFWKMEGSQRDVHGIEWEGYEDFRFSWDFLWDENEMFMGFHGD